LRPRPVLNLRISVAHFIHARGTRVPFTNAVLEDKALQAGLSSIHPKFGDLCTRVAGEVWGQPLVSQKTKTFITIAVDVANGNLNGPGAPFEAHVDMALKQGASVAEIEEILLFVCAYAGFNKAEAPLAGWRKSRPRAKRPSAPHVANRVVHRLC